MRSQRASPRKCAHTTSTSTSTPELGKADAHAAMLRGAAQLLLVMMTGWLLRAKGTGAESVNCYATKVNATDIHLSIPRPPRDERVLRRHGRDDPALTTRGVASWSISLPRQAQTEEEAPQRHTRVHRLETDRRPPIRITGQLFFDASHTVCRDGGIAHRATRIGRSTPCTTSKPAPPRTTTTAPSTTTTCGRASPTGTPIRTSRTIAAVPRPQPIAAGGRALENASG